MNILNVRCRATAIRYAWSVVTPRTTSKPVVVAFCRNFATHRDDFDFSTRSSLSRGFDSKHSADPKHESVGPFQLGLSQQALRTGKKVPKWSELDTKGKGRCHRIASYAYTQYAFNFDQSFGRQPGRRTLASSSLVLVYQLC